LIHSFSPTFSSSSPPTSPTLSISHPYLFPLFHWTFLICFYTSLLSLFLLFLSALHPQRKPNTTVTPQVLCSHYMYASPTFPSNSPAISPTCFLSSTRHSSPAFTLPFCDCSFSFLLPYKHTQQETPHSRHRSLALITCMLPFT
jgi:hypothetical protein